MADALTIASLMVKIGADLQPLNKGLGKAGGMLKSAVAPIAKIATGLALGAVAGIGAVGGAIAKLAMDAAQIEPIRRDFERLSESIGESTNAMIEGMRKASSGMVADSDLMLSANRLISMGLAGSAEEASNLTHMAVRLGEAMGKGPTQAMEEFALMMANQSIPRLDTFGISAGRVRTRIAELMEANQALTREEAFAIAVRKEGQESLARLGEGGKGAAATMARLRATFANITEHIGSAFLPILDALLTPLSELAQKHGPQVVEWARQFSEWLRIRLIPNVLDFGKKIVIVIREKVIPTFQAIIKAIPWGQILDVLDKVASGIGLVGGAILDVIGKIPGLQGLLDKVPWSSTVVQADTVTDALAKIGETGTASIADVIAKMREMAADDAVDHITGSLSLMADAFMKIDPGDVAFSELETNLRGLGGAIEEINAFYPELTPFASFLQETLIPHFGAWLGVLAEVGAVLGTIAREVIGRVLLPAWIGLVTYIDSQVIRINDALIKKLNTLGDAISGKLQPIVDFLRKAFIKLRDSIDWATGKLGEIQEAINNFRIGGGLMALLDKILGQSPSPLEESLLRITAAAKDTMATLGGMSLPAGQTVGAGGMTLAGAGASGQPLILAPIFLDRSDFEGPDGELDYGAIGQQVMGGRLY
jgi:hypothetical protein